MYFLKIVITIFAVFICSSCERDLVTNSNNGAKSYLVSQIISSRGYQQSIKLDKSEKLSYFENLFALFILDKERFLKLIKFLHEDGKELSGFEEELKFVKILNSDNYKSIVQKVEHSELYTVRLLIKDKICYQTLIDSRNISIFSDMKNFRIKFDEFTEHLRSNTKAF
ncbi:MAG: hypothetical protein JHD23_04355 [Akkermansiaceae bacterium]|jgi:hypothetical protein|nr:hypothetical protein [Akkermansiaceae bacterium]